MTDATLRSEVEGTLHPVGLSIQNAMVTIHRSCCAGQVCQVHRRLRKPRALVSSQVLAAALSEAATLTLSPGSVQLASHAGPLGCSVRPTLLALIVGPFLCWPAYEPG